MTAPYQRRRDPQPMGQGWEVAVVAIGGAVLGLGLAALLGIAVGSAVFGGGWVWPHGTDVIGRVLAGVLAGHPGHGFPPVQAARVAGAVPVYGCIVVVELMLLVLSVLAAVMFVRYHRPGDARGGMATRSEAEQVLGMSKLRAAKEIIRPDLYGAGAAKESS